MMYAGEAEVVNECAALFNFGGLYTLRTSCGPRGTSQSRQRPRGGAADPGAQHSVGLHEQNKPFTWRLPVFCCGY
jgi:hypothetical protein